MKLIRKYMWSIDADDEKTKHDDLIHELNRCDEKNQFKVICAGHGRTGTTSLRLALNILKLPTYDMLEMTMYNEAYLWDELMRQKLKSGLDDDKLISYKEWNKIYVDRNFVACTDEPSDFFYRELSNHYKNAKIILTVRDANDWYDSCLTTIHKIGGMFEDRWLLRLIAWWQKRVHFTNNLWNLMMLMGPESVDTSTGFKTFKTDKQYGIDAFNKWNESVIKWCKDNNKQLLVYQISHGWEPLCRFLEVDAPNESFPHAHSRETFQKLLRNTNWLCDVVNGLLVVGTVGCVYGTYWFYTKQK